MFVARTILSILLVLCWMSVSRALAADAPVEVRILDARGAPLPDAVVWLRGDEAGGARTQTPRAPATAVVAQRGHRFVPFVQPVAVDTVVSFPNYDDTRHHVYSFSPAKTFEIKLYRGDPDVQISFDAAGVVALGCNIHDYMQGFIYVTDAPVFGVTDADGWVRFARAELPPGNLELGAWHPWQQRETAAVALPSGAASGELVIDIAPPPPVRPEQNALRDWVQEAPK